MKNFPSAIIKELNYYVYLYIDPRNNKIFYVGKGNKNRCFSHLKDTYETDKVNRIKEIQNEGKKPIIEFLIHGVDEYTALRVEAAVIDLLNVKKLTNIVKGHSSSKIGRMSTDKLLSLHKKEKAIIEEPSVLIKISKTFNYSMSAQELYDATRQFWRIGNNKNKIKYAFSVYDGMIQEVYKIIDWYPGGTTFTTRTVEKEHKNKWEFIGKIADENIRRKYIYKDVSDIAKYQSSIYYLNIK
jgi:uncharacterized protein